MITIRKYNIKNLAVDFKDYGSYFMVKGDRINYEDILSLEWYWISRTINFVNFQDTELTLFYKNRDAIAYLFSRNFRKTPPLVTLYMHIAEKTYLNRLKRYTREIDEKGYCSYGNAKFYTDATVGRKDGKVFSLEKVRIEAFSLYLRSGGLFGPKMTIDIKIDGDVIRSLINFFLKKPVSPQKVINGEIRYTPQERINKQIVHLIGMLSKMAKVDGVVSQEEIGLIYDFMNASLRFDEKDIEDAIKIFNQEKTSVTSFEFHTREYMQINQSDIKILKSTLDLLFALSLADGYLSAEEELLLKQASSIFNISDSNYHDYLKRIDRKREHEMVYYYHILGLEQTVTKEEVKRKYRMLALQYHPDRHMSVDSKLAKEMEEKFKEISGAYEYLTKNCFN
ncbi:TerB family tellurite resistance protein [bacterium]|nr:TerB family tellurite resistance protein [bacterium]